MKKIKSVHWLAAISASVFLTACMPSEPDGAAGTADEYIYKGKPDQLMSEPSVNRAAKLSERFKLIQARQ